MDVRVALTPVQAGEALGVSDWTIRRLIKAGLLKRIPHLGDRVLIARAEIERFANQGVDTQASAS